MAVSMNDDQGTQRDHEGQDCGQHVENGIDTHGRVILAGELAGVSLGRASRPAAPSPRSGFSHCSARYLALRSAASTSSMSRTGRFGESDRTDSIKAGISW